MTLILTMAGLYSRFIDEGYKFPKYLLPWGDRTILSKILAELKRGNTFTNFLLVGNVRDEAYTPHIQAILRGHGIGKHALTMIKDTKGQAETAAVAMDLLKKLKPGHTGPIAFHNIDTILCERDCSHISQSLRDNDGYIDIFSSNNHAYSYVLAEGNGQVKEVAEKTVISNIATSGLYGFASTKVFQDFYRPEDLYITSIYKRMIQQDRRVVVGPKYNESNTIVLGTPTEYLNASITASLDHF
jgi:NDP-sugar pyrophosphorylase family protein